MVGKGDGASVNPVVGEDVGAGVGTVVVGSMVGLTVGRAVGSVVLGCDVGLGVAIVGGLDAAVQLVLIR